MALDPKLTKFSTASPIAALFSFTDVDEGTGIVVYLGSDTEDDGTTTYQLSKNAVYSSRICTKATASSGNTDQKVLDLDFDVTFNFPKDLKGKVIANIPVAFGTENSANREGSCYAILKVRHVTSGGSESGIASNTKSKISEVVASLDTIQQVFNVEVDCPLTHFASGETLRLTVEIWKDTSGTSGLQLALAHDPKNRIIDSSALAYGLSIDTGEFITSILSFNVPFLIE